MNILKQNLLYAEKIAMELFEEIIHRNLIIPGKTEQQLSDEVFEIAKINYGIENHWHKRLVRSGENTLYPYYAELPNREIEQEDILFFDFGPIIEKWEADLGRTYVVGEDKDKLKLKKDVETAWQEGKEWFLNQKKATGAELFHFIVSLSKKYNWEFGGEIAGHLIGEFPHEKMEKGNYNLYIHPENKNDMRLLDSNGNERHWILEIHFVDRQKKIGGFYEQLLV